MTVDPETLHAPGQETFVREVRHQHGFALVGQALGEHRQSRGRNRQVVQCDHEQRLPALLAYPAPTQVAGERAHLSLRFES